MVTQHSTKVGSASTFFQPAFSERELDQLLPSSSSLSSSPDSPPLPLPCTLKEFRNASRALGILNAAQLRALKEGLVQVSPRTKRSAGFRTFLLGLHRNLLKEMRKPERQDLTARLSLLNQIERQLVDLTDGEERLHLLQSIAQRERRLHQMHRFSLAIEVLAPMLTQAYSILELGLSEREIERKVQGIVEALQRFSAEENRSLQESIALLLALPAYQHDRVLKFLLSDRSEASSGILQDYFTSLSDSRLNASQLEAKRFEFCSRMVRSSTSTVGAIWRLSGCLVNLCRGALHLSSPRVKEGELERNLFALDDEIHTWSSQLKLLSRGHFQIFQRQNELAQLNESSLSLVQRMAEQSLNDRRLSAAQRQSYARLVHEDLPEAAGLLELGSTLRGHSLFFARNRQELFMGPIGALAAYGSRHLGMFFRSPLLNALIVGASNGGLQIFLQLLCSGDISHLVTQQGTAEFAQACGVGMLCGLVGLQVTYLGGTLSRSASLGRIGENGLATLRNKGLHLVFDQSKFWADIFTEIYGDKGLGILLAGQLGNQGLKQNSFLVVINNVTGEVAGDRWSEGGQHVSERFHLEFAQNIQLQQLVENFHEFYGWLDLPPPTLEESSDEQSGDHGALQFYSQQFTQFLMAYVQQGGTREELHRYLNSKTLMQIKKVTDLFTASKNDSSPQIPLLFFLNAFAQAHFNRLDSLPFAQMSLRLQRQFQSIF